MYPFMDGEPDGRSVVVVGVDFTEASDRALTIARNLTDLAKTPELHIVHVFPSLRTMGLGETAASSDALMLEPVRQARASLAKYADEVASNGRRVVTHLRFGEAAREIVQLAVDVGADLIVVGTHGRSGLERMLLGSTADRVVRYAPCPVLTARPKRQPRWVEIEPPCPDCLAVQRATQGQKLWCARHSEHHGRAHLHYEYPASFAVGAQTFREPE